MSFNNSSTGNTVPSYTITKEEQIFNLVFLTIVSLMTIFGNTIALHAFLVTPELKRTTYYFIASLSISDLMVASLSIPIWIVQLMNNFMVSETLLYFHACLDIFCGTLSIMSLAMISIERFICIKYALYYSQIMTKRRVFYIIFCIVIYASVSTAMNFLVYIYTRETNNTVFTILEVIILLMAFVIPVILKVFSYSNIYREAKKQVGEIAKHHHNIGQLSSISDSETTTSSVDLNDNDSVTGKTSHSNSRSSWTTSPLARRKRDSIVTRNDSITPRSDSPESDYSEEYSQGKGDSVGLLKGKLQELVCFSRLNNSEENTTYENENMDEQVTKRSVRRLNSRQNTDSSIKSILKKKSREEESHLMKTNEETDGDKDASPHVNNLSRKEKARSVFIKNNTSLEESTIEEECNSERDRSISCPYSKQTRKSLDINGLPVQKESRNGSSSPFLRRFRGSSKGSDTNSPSVIRRNREKQKRQEQKIRRFKKELRAAKVVGLIMGTFLTCWMPFMFFIVLNILGKPFKMILLVIAIDLHYLNSAINPILYVLLNKVYRNAVMKVLKKIKRRLHWKKHCAK